MAIKLDQNYAQNANFAEEIATNLLEIWESCRTQRRVREEVWQESYRAWSIDATDADQNYHGMSNIKVPQIRKEVETMARRIYKGLLPDDYLRAEMDGGLGDQELITVNTQVVRHYLDNVIMVKKPFYPWIKQLVILGTSPIRGFWHKAENEMFFKKREPYTDNQGIIRYKLKQVRENVITYNAPKLRAEDMFNTWIYPHHVSSPEDIEIHFYRTRVKKSDLEHKAKQGMCARLKDVDAMGEELVYEFDQAQERMSQFGDSGEEKVLQGNQFYELLEVWCNLVLPDSDGRAVPCVVEIVGQKFATRIQRNPYWHQKAPIDYGRFIIPPPGEFYGRGLPEAVASLGVQLDDTMNQTMDATNLAVAPMTIINPAYAPNAESFEVEPGATWWADPNAVKQFAFPDLTDAGYKAANTLKGWIGELSDNQPQLPDPVAGKARSTGQAQLAINEWQTDLFTFIDFLSMEALNEIAFKTHSLIQQYISDDDIIRVAGRYAGTWTDRVVTPQDIVGRYKFKWVGALQIENQSIKTQQMLNFMNVYKNIPPEAQAEVKMRWENYLIKLLRDGFMIKDVENIVETPRMTASVRPEIEEKILKLGGEIDVHESDDDDAHARYHLFEQGQDKNPVTRAKRSLHLEAHAKNKNEKMQKQAMAVQQMQMAMAQGGQGQAPQGSGGRAGNPSAIPANADPANMNRGMKLGV